MKKTRKMMSINYFRSNNIPLTTQDSQTKEDLEILKYHYSYGMCKGIDMENFDKIHNDYKATLEKHPNSRLYLVHTN